MRLVAIIFLKFLALLFWLPGFSLIWISFYFSSLNWYLFCPTSTWWTSGICPEWNSVLSLSKLFLSIVFQIWGNSRGTHPLKPGFFPWPTPSFILNTSACPAYLTAQTTSALSSALELSRWQWQISFLESCTCSQNGSQLPCLHSSIHSAAL